MDVGIQLYSVRDITEKNLELALEQIAKQGYKSVEFAGFFGHSADEVKGWLDKYNLRASGTHTPLDPIVKDYDAIVAYHKAIGTTNIIIPGHDLSTNASLDAFIESVAVLIPKLKKDGITLHYHNHDFEFRPNNDGVIPYDELLTRTELFMELDTYWCFVGGRDPIATLESLKGRSTVLHIKDGMGDHEGKPLGQGVAPVAKVWAKGKELGIYPVVESETLKPDGLTEAAVCIEYLRTLG